MRVPGEYFLVHSSEIISYMLKVVLDALFIWCYSKGSRRYCRNCSLSQIPNRVKQTAVYVCPDMPAVTSIYISKQKGGFSDLLGGSVGQHRSLYPSIQSTVLSEHQITSFCQLNLLTKLSFFGFKFKFFNIGYSSPTINRIAFILYSHLP